jgi:hypothetical protein
MIEGGGGVNFFEPGLFGLQVHLLRHDGEATTVAKDDFDQGVFVFASWWWERGPYGRGRRGWGGVRGQAGGWICSC